MIVNNNIIRAIIIIKPRSYEEVDL